MNSSFEAMNPLKTTSTAPIHPYQTSPVAVPRSPTRYVLDFFLENNIFGDKIDVRSEGAQ